MRKDSERSQSGRSKRIKVDAPKGSKWAVQNTESGRSETLKVDGSKSLKWTVTNKNERPKKVRMEGELRIRVQLGLSTDISFFTRLQWSSSSLLHYGLNVAGKESWKKI